MLEVSSSELLGNEQGSLALWRFLDKREIAGTRRRSLKLQAPHEPHIQPAVCWFARCRLGGRDGEAQATQQTHLEPLA